jgi:hypothetical protein
MTVVTMPGVRMSPQTALHNILDKVDEVESVVIVTSYKDGDIVTSWSNMPTGDLCMASLVLQDYATRVLRGEYDDDIIVTPKPKGD